jgi:hypothetical protein
MVCGNTRFISSVEHDTSRVRLSLLSVLEISIKHYTLYNNSFYFGYRSPIRLRNNFINPIRNEYFGSEIRTNPIGSDSDGICTPLVHTYVSVIQVNLT